MKLRLAEGARIFGIAALAVALPCVQASATPVVDQSQSLFNLGVPFSIPCGTGCSDNDLPVGQSFEAGLTGLLTEFDVFSNGQTTGAPSVTVEVLQGSGTGGSPSDVLGSMTVSVPGNSFNAGVNGYLVPFDLSGLGINVTAGLEYTFLITAVSGDFGSRGILGDDNNPYANGRTFASAYGSGAAGWDLQFRSWVDTEPDPPAVPEPTSIMLLGSGLGAVSVLIRRRRV